MRKAATKFLIFSSLAISSCAPMSYVPQIQKYTPQISLDISPRTINKSAQIALFEDSSPEEDKRTPPMGLSVTDYESLGSELNMEVTHAVVSDFSANRLFKEAGRKVENPDFIIKGEIKKFYGKHQLNAFARVSPMLAIGGAIGSLITPWASFACLPVLVPYFGIPMSANTSEVVIEMRLYDNKDNLINTYTGKSIDFISASMYKNKASQVVAMTNRAFSNAIMQIRDQILADADKMD